VRAILALPVARWILGYLRYAILLWAVVMLITALAWVLLPLWVMATGLMPSAAVEGITRLAFQPWAVLAAMGAALVLVLIRPAPAV
jgi:hypothetical protein